jgi:hypothetical protein
MATSSEWILIFIRLLIAKPAASSFALLILMPVDRRSIEFDNRSPFERNDPSAASAEIFELMANGIVDMLKVSHLYKQYSFLIL